jgi:hypothetical protein
MKQIRNFSIIAHPGTRTEVPYGASIDHPGTKAELRTGREEVRLDQV